MNLTWKRDPNSGHWAYGTDLGYQLERDGKTWLLKVRRIVETAGVRHTLGEEVIHILTRRFDTLPEGKYVAQVFEDDPHHDMHNAVMAYHNNVTQPKIDAITAEYDRVFGH